jgi:hypothetical protein
MRDRRLALLIAALLPALASADPLADAITDAKLDLDLRYRVESVDQEGFADQALASTLRARLGATSGTVGGFSAVVTFESITSVGDDRYNSTANGRTNYPTVADPADEELDQAYLQWKGGAWTLRYGRQRFVLGNHRFFGNVGFRQNEQTFDGATAAGAIGPGTLTLAWLTDANRLFGAHHPIAASADTPIEARLVDYSAAFGPGKLSVYAHLIDYPLAPTAAHRNLGARYAGEWADPWLGGKLRFAAEHAEQDDYADGAATIDQQYDLAELGYGWEQVGFRVGHERLGGDGTRGFATPFATLHAFNGWADRFLATPAAGLIDSYLKLDARRGALSGYLAWHRFDSDAGTAHWGNEVDAAVVWNRDAHTAFKVELARYTANGLGADTRILWLTAELRY